MSEVPLQRAIRPRHAARGVFGVLHDRHVLPRALVQRIGKRARQRLHQPSSILQRRRTPDRRKLSRVALRRRPRRNPTPVLPPTPTNHRHHLA